MMCCYRFDYFGDRHFLRSARIEADTDLEAVWKARHNRGIDSVEIWCGPRKVQLLPAVDRKLLSPPAPPPL